MNVPPVRRGLSFVIKVPLVLALVAAGIGLGTSVMIDRLLRNSQERELDTVARAYLDGLAPALIDPAIRQDIWGVFEVLDSHSPLSAAIRPLETVVTDREGTVIASSNPATTRSGTQLPERFVASHQRLETPADAAAPRTFASQLFSNGRRVGAVHVELDVTPMLAERSALHRTLILCTMTLSVMLGIGGWLLLRRMIRPVELLARHMEAVEADAVNPIPEVLFPPVSREFQHLFHSYNRMAGALRERQALLGRVIAEERLASLGRMAAGVAHEINNPLGGLFTTLHLLRNDRRAVPGQRKALDLLERGLTGIREIVRAMLNVHGPHRDTRPLTGNDFADLRLLVAPEIRAKALRLSWTVAQSNGIALAAAPVRQITLNLLLNAIEATPPGGFVGLAVTIERDFLRLEVTDSGSGLDPERKAFIEDPRSLHPPVGDGLGLWLIRQIAAELRATIVVDRSRFGGSSIAVTIPLTPAEELTNAA